MYYISYYIYLPNTYEVHDLHRLHWVGLFGFIFTPSVGYRLHYVVYYYNCISLCLIIMLHFVNISNPVMGIPRD